MKSLMRLAAPLAIAAAIFSACNNNADVDVTTDSTGMGMDTVTTYPADTVSSAPMDTLGSASDTMGNVAGGVKDESIEKVVEAALVVKPGFEGVTVGSRPDGIIILTGTVTSQTEKDEAGRVAKGTAGVKQVENNLTVKK